MDITPKPAAHARQITRSIVLSEEQLALFQELQKRDRRTSFSNTVVALALEGADCRRLHSPRNGGAA